MAAMQAFAQPVALNSPVIARNLRASIQNVPGGALLAAEPETPVSLANGASSAMVLGSAACLGLATGVTARRKKKCSAMAFQAVVPLKGAAAKVARQATGVLEVPVVLTGCTMQASLKMRCDTSGAGYAIYWTNVNGKLVVAGDYVTDARKAALKAKGLDKSFAEESESFAVDASGEGPVASVYKSQEPIFIKDVAASSMKRKDLAAKYAIAQVCFVPFEGGVLEFGTSDGPCTADWTEMPKVPTMPKAAMRKGFENLGASYCMFWSKEGDSFKVVADYVTDARKRALKESRGDDETFCSKSREMTVDANGDGPIATAFKTKTEVTIVDASEMKRAALAKEFGVKRVHFIPTACGVLEYGSPVNVGMTGNTLAASLKMRCDTSGAGYALYWNETDGKAVVAGDYVTPARKAALEAKGKTSSFAEASKEYKMEVTGNGPIATVLKTREPVYIQDVATCDTMKRGGLAVEYGIKSICLVPVPGGVLEYGTSDSSCTADWTCMEDARKAIMPKEDLQNAFDEGATHAIFWWKDGDNYVVGADYVIPERLRALKAARGDDKTYTTESENVKIPVDSNGPVATSARSGKELVLEDPSSDSNFLRKGLAAEFNVKQCHFVPCKDGVLEYGSGITK